MVGTYFIEIDSKARTSCAGLLYLNKEIDFYVTRCYH